MPASLTMVPLADRPALEPVVAGWLVSEWGGSSRDRTRAEIEAALLTRLQIEVPPIAFVAIEASRSVGTASLKVQEVSERPQYQSWLGAVFVPPEERRRGIGSGLVRNVAQVAGALGIERLYLSTRSSQRLHRCLGWTEPEQLAIGGRQAVIIQRCLGRTAAS
jgi:GNAT superfamily N-acetyltransferase